MSPSLREVLEIRKTVRFDAPIERVWNALTDPAQLGAWFPDAVELKSTDPGSRGWLVWERHGRYAFRIEEVDAPRRLVWSWARKPGRELEDTPTTRVEWRLDATAEGGTTLELHESGFETDEARRDNDQGWDKELGELVEMLTG